VCKSNCIHGINEVFTVIQKSVSPFRKCLPYKESFLSLNKLDKCLSLKYLKYLRGEIIQKTRQDMITAQENMNPDSGFRSLWNCHQSQISLVLRINDGKTAAGSQPTDKRHLHFFTHWAERSRPIPISPGGKVTILGPSVRRPGSQCTFRDHLIY
jgi:hypothetical protein